MRGTRWLIFAPVAALAWVAPASADVVTGLSVTGYTVDEIPPVRSDAAYPMCGQGTLDFINATWDSPEQQFGDCGLDQFMLHYTGAIQIPEHDTIEFWLASDDGGTVKIGVHEFGVWVDQGCSATESGLLDLDAGTHQVDAWVYENGGATCFMLAWNIDDTGWAIVPPEAFTSEPTPDTTVPDTTVPDTTLPDTTVLETTTSSTTTSSTIYVTTSQTPVTTSTSTTTTSTTTTAAPVPTQTSTTTTEPPAIPSTTTTATPIETSTTWPSTTAPETTVAVISTTSSAAPSTTAVATSSTFAAIETTVPAVETTVVTTPVTETTVDLVQELSDLSDAVDGLADVLPDQITVADITAITDSQAFDLLSDDQIGEIAEIISGASDEVKEAFESAVDVFADDALSEYVPAGSTISVAKRRAVIAVTALTFVLPLPIPTQGRSHDQSQRKR